MLEYETKERQCGAHGSREIRFRFTIDDPDERISIEHDEYVVRVENSSTDYAKLFTTGGAAHGYVLDKIDVGISSGTCVPIDGTAEIRTFSASGGGPGTYVPGLRRQWQGSATFRALPGTKLNPDTGYYVVMLAEGATRFSDTGNSRTALADGANLAGVTVNSMTRFKRNLKTANAWVPDEDDDPLRIALTLNAAAAPPAPAAEPADDSVDWKTSITVGNWSTRRGERERGWRVQDCVQTREDVSDIEDHSPDDICYGQIGQKQFTVGSMTYMLEGVYHGVSSADDSVTMEFEGEADLTALADRAFIINGTTFWMSGAIILGGIANAQAIVWPEPAWTHAGGWAVGSTVWVGLQVGTSRSRAAPTVEGTPGLSASGSDGSWTPGQTVEAIMTFSEAVTVDTSSGTPAITLTLGGTLEQSAIYTRGSGSKALVFVYTLIESDGSHTAMGVKPDSLALNGGSITSEANGADADLGHNGAIIMGERDGGTGPRGVRGVPQRSGPTASFSDLPATHDGKKPFTVKLSFSADPRGLSYKTVRDSLLEVTGATVTGALRVNDASDREWKVTVAPSQGYAITLTLPPRACGETAAVCVGGRSLSRAASARIPGKALTASLTGPAEHDGSESFTVRLTFSMEPHMSYKTVRDTMFTEKGGAITGARRVKPPHDREFDIVVKPGGDAAVSFSLASPLPACGETGAVCTAPGRMLEGAASVSIPGPAALSVADATVREGPAATLDFVVTLSRTRGQATTVQYATSDGTAIADADYTPKSGTLTFAAGEREKTVSVEILDDLHDDGGETMTLTLTNPVGARIADGAATGTIENTGHIPKAWLARFGRTVADQVLDAVDERMRGGSASTRMTLGGREVLLDAEWPKEGEALRTSPLTGAKGPGGAGDFLRGGVDPREREHLFERKAADALASRAHSMGELLLASSFHLASAEGREDASRWSLWGRGARSSFSGRDGELTLDGDVTTGLVGADYESGEALLGVALAWSAGDGSYKGEGAAGELESTLASVYPYLRYRMSERLSVWGVVGMGEGDLTLKTPTGEKMETGLSLAMAALGVRGALISRAGYELAVKSDFTFVRTESEKTTGLASAEAGTRRLRLVLEGSREMDLGAGSLTPSVEVGLRYDGGDAETGAGVELGGGVRYAASGLTMEVRARGLLAHEESDYEEWGVSASLVFSPGSEGRGLSMRVGSAWGAASGGADRIWTGGAAGLAGSADPPGASLPGASLDAEVAYGLDAVRGLLTPYAGVALSENGETWRAGARWKLGPAFDLELEANLKEPVGDEEPEGGLLLRGSRRW